MGSSDPKASRGVRRRKRSGAIQPRGYRCRRHAPDHRSQRSDDAAGAGAVHGEGELIRQPAALAAWTRHPRHSSSPELRANRDARLEALCLSLCRAPRRILLASGRHTPNRIPDVIGNQQGTGLVDGQPDPLSPGPFIRVQEAGDDVLGFAARTSAAERHENDLVAVEACPVPTAMFADEGAAAGAILLRSGDRASFGSALRRRRRAEPDAVVKIGTYGPWAEFIKTAPS